MGCRPPGVGQACYVSQWCPQHGAAAEAGVPWAMESMALVLILLDAEDPEQR